MMQKAVGAVALGAGLAMGTDPTDLLPELKDAYPSLQHATYRIFNSKLQTVQPQPETYDTTTERIVSKPKKLETDKTELEVVEIGSDEFGVFLTGRYEISTAPELLDRVVRALGRKGGVESKIFQASFLGRYVHIHLDETEEPEMCDSSLEIMLPKNTFDDDVVADRNLDLLLGEITNGVQLWDSRPHERRFGVKRVYIERLYKLIPLSTITFWVGYVMTRIGLRNMEFFQFTKFVRQIHNFEVSSGITEFAFEQTLDGYLLCPNGPQLMASLDFEQFLLALNKKFGVQKTTEDVELKEIQDPDTYLTWFDGEMGYTTLRVVTYGNLDHTRTPVDHVYDEWAQSSVKALKKEDKVLLFTGAENKGENDAWHAAGTFGINETDELSQLLTRAGLVAVNDLGHNTPFGETEASLTITINDTHEEKGRQPSVYDMLSIAIPYAEEEVDGFIKEMLEEKKHHSEYAFVMDTTGFPAEEEVYGSIKKMLEKKRKDSEMAVVVDNTGVPEEAKLNSKILAQLLASINKEIEEKPLTPTMPFSDDSIIQTAMNAYFNKDTLQVGMEAEATPVYTAAMIGKMVASVILPDGSKTKAVVARVAAFAAVVAAFETLKPRLARIALAVAIAHVYIPAKEDGEYRLVESAAMPRMLLGLARLKTPEREMVQNFDVRQELAEFYQDSIVPEVTAPAAVPAAEV